MRSPQSLSPLFPIKSNTKAVPVITALVAQKLVLQNPTFLFLNGSHDGGGDGRFSKAMCEVFQLLYFQKEVVTSK